MWGCKRPPFSCRKTAPWWSACRTLLPGRGSLAARAYGATDPCGKATPAGWRHVAAVADWLDFEHKCRSLVIAWASDDQPTDAQIETVLDEFEKTAWAGLEPDRYAWSAIVPFHPVPRDAAVGIQDARLRVFACRELPSFARGVRREGGSRGPPPLLSCPSRMGARNHGRDGQLGMVWPGFLGSGESPVGVAMPPSELVSDLGVVSLASRKVVCSSQEFFGIHQVIEPPHMPEPHRVADLVTDQIGEGTSRVSAQLDASGEPAESRAATGLVVKSRDFRNRDPAVFLEVLLPGQDLAAVTVPGQRPHEAWDLTVHRGDLVTGEGRAAGIVMRSDVEVRTRCRQDGNKPLFNRRARATVRVVVWARARARAVMGVEH